MTTFGRNMKLTVARSRREALNRALTEGLGARTMSSEPALSVYRLDDDFNIGIYFVDDEHALTDEQQLAAPWLELLVEDVPAAAGRLADLEVERIAYDRDPAHTYYRLPGGPVFRLATAPP